MRYPVDQKTVRALMLNRKRLLAYTKHILVICNVKTAIVIPFLEDLSCQFSGSNCCRKFQKIHCFINPHHSAIAIVRYWSGRGLGRGRGRGNRGRSRGNRGRGRGRGWVGDGVRAAVSSSTCW